MDETVGEGVFRGVQVWGLGEGAKYHVWGVGHEREDGAGDLP